MTSTTHKAALRHENKLDSLALGSSAERALHSEIESAWDALRVRAKRAIQALPANAWDTEYLRSVVDQTRLGINSRLTSTAGYGTVNRGQELYFVTVSLPIFLDPRNKTAPRNRTGLTAIESLLAHELAHVLQFSDGRNHAPHGKTWIFFDLLLGDDGERTHQLKIGGAVPELNELMQF